MSNTLTTTGGKLFLVAVAITQFARSSANFRFIDVAPTAAVGAVDVAVVLTHREDEPLERLPRYPSPLLCRRMAVEIVGRYAAILFVNDEPVVDGLNAWAVVTNRELRLAARSFMLSQ